MSGTLGDLMLNSARYLTGEQPKMQAETQETYSRIPLNQAQAAEAQAKVPYWGAETGFVGANTTKAQIDNAMQQILLNRMRGLGGGGGGNQGGGGTTYPREPGTTAPPPADQSSYTPPSQQPDTPPPRVPPGVWLPPGSPAATGTSTAANYPASGAARLQLASADTGTMSDVGPQLYSPGYQPVAQPTATGAAALQLAQAGPPAGSPPAGRPPAVSAPLPPGSNAAALQAQSGPYNPNGTSDAGTFVPGVGAVPKDMEFDYLWGLKSGANPVELKRGLTAQRNQYLATQAQMATSPQDWDRRVEQLWRDGWLSHHDANLMQGRFDGRAGIITSLTTPAEQTQTEVNRATQGRQLGPSGNLEVSPSAVAGAGATTRARTEAEGQTQLWTVPGPDGQPREIRVPLSNTQQFLDEQRRLGVTPKPGAVVPGPGSSSAPAGGGPGTSNVTNNNPGNLTFANQPGASRVPGSQFASFPDAATGVAATADQLAINQDQHNIQSVSDQVKRWVGPNDVRTKPAVVAKYIADTAQALGVDPNARVDWHDPNVQAKFIQAQQQHETRGTLAQADVEKGVQMAAARRGTQYAGPGVPQDNTPAGAIVRGMVDQGANPATLAPGGSGAAAGPQVAQSRYGVPTGVPVWTPEQKEAAERDRPLIEKDAETTRGLGADQLALDQSISSMHDVLARVDESITGKGSDWRRNLSAGLAQFGAPWVQDFVKRLSDGNIDPSKAENSEVVMKQLFLASQQAESQLIKHGGIGSSQLYASMFPNPNMRPGSIKEMTNFLSMMQQRTRDWNQGAMEHFNKNYDVRPGEIDPATGTPKRYQPLTKFTQNFNKTGSDNAPQVYGAAVAIMNHKPPDTWTRGLSDDQQWAAIQTAKRADPTWKIEDRNQIPKKFWPKEWQD